MAATTSASPALSLKRGRVPFWVKPPPWPISCRASRSGIFQRSTSDQKVPEVRPVRGAWAAGSGASAGASFGCGGGAAGFGEAALERLLL
jgi:hypothetical protein